MTTIARIPAVTPVLNVTILSLEHGYNAFRGLNTWTVVLEADIGNGETTTFTDDALDEAVTATIQTEDIAGTFTLEDYVENIISPYVEEGAYSEAKFTELMGDPDIKAEYEAALEEERMTIADVVLDDMFDEGLKFYWTGAEVTSSSLMAVVQNIEPLLFWGFDANTFVMERVGYLDYHSLKTGSFDVIDTAVLRASRDDDICQFDVLAWDGDGQVRLFNVVTNGDIGEQQDEGVAIASVEQLQEFIEAWQE